MRVRVLYFGVLKDVLGRGGEDVALDDAASVASLVGAIRAREQVGADALWGSLAVAVNREYVRGDVVLREGDEVALLPPVSGGLDAR